MPVRASLKGSDLWLIVLPIAAISLARQITAISGPLSEWLSVIYIAEMLQGSLISGFIFAAVSIGLAQLKFGAALVYGFSVCYSIVLCGDWLLILYAKTRLSFRAINSIHGGVEGLLSYANITSLSIASCSLLGCLASSFFTRRGVLRGLRGLALGIGAIALILLVVEPSNILRRAVGLSTIIMDLGVKPGTVRDKINTSYLDAARYSSSPLINLVSDLLGRKLGLVVSDLDPIRSSIVSPFVVQADLTSANFRPFRRIILVTMESMTMDLTSRYNTALGGELTPFLDSLTGSLVNFRCASTPTQFGLASHLCSHPNGIALVDVGHPNALPEYLESLGWNTCYMQGASLDFQSGRRRFRELGYGDILGLEEHALDSKNCKLISGWGLCDRELFGSAVSWLASRRNQKTFLHVLTADTHAPGRDDYHGLQYPETPIWIKDSGQHFNMLQSWFRADFDIKTFISRLREEGLMDVDTAVIITGDHTYHRSNLYLQLPGVSKSAIGRIPWFFLSARANFQPETRRLSSHIDTAPSIAHLAGARPLVGWWGTSLFAQVPSRPILAFSERATFLLEENSQEQRATEDLVSVGWVIEAKGFFSRDGRQRFQTR